MDPVTFSLWAGLAGHWADVDKPEISEFDNPIGIVQLDAHFNDRFKAFCKHESSITRDEEGYGFNECGLMLRIK